MLIHDPGLGTLLGGAGAFARFGPAGLAHDEPSILERGTQSVVAAHMIKMAVRHEDVSDFIERHADGAKILKEPIHERFVKRVDERPAGRRFYCVGGDPADADIPDVVENAIGVDRLNGGIVEPAVQLGRHSARVGKLGECLGNVDGLPARDVGRKGAALRSFRAKGFRRSQNGRHGERASGEQNAPS